MDLDNRDLEISMDIDVEKVGVEEQDRFLKNLKVSRLFLPVVLRGDDFQVIHELDSETPFSVNYLTDDDGNRILPLFTGLEQMAKANIRTSLIAFDMSEISDMLSQADEKYSTVSINPFTDLNINVPVSMILNMFKKDRLVSSFLGLLNESSIELDDDYTFYVGGDDDFMKGQSADGVFTCDAPFYVSTDRNVCSDFEYLNIILIPKKSRVMFLGDVEEGRYDTIVAPQSEFLFLDDLDEFTRLWKCTRQRFFEDIRDS